MINKSLKFKNKKNNGFTLVETLIAISIFTIAILALMSVLASGISDTHYAKQKILASYLAQEGIEYLRNMRDTYVLYSQNGNTWNQFKAKLNPCNQGNECGIDNTLFVNDNNFIKKCNSLNDCKLLVDNGNYNTSTGTDSGFTRKIWMTNLSSDELKIFSSVSWTQGSGNYVITFSESLFDWTE